MHHVIQGAWCFWCCVYVRVPEIFSTHEGNTEEENKKGLSKQISWEMGGGGGLHYTAHPHPFYSMLL
jgi:hypothetical protein